MWGMIRRKAQSEAAEQALMFKNCADDADEYACRCRTKYDAEFKAWEVTKP
jgi:hypothetical protein